TPTPTPTGPAPTQTPWAFAGTAIDVAAMPAAAKIPIASFRIGFRIGNLLLAARGKTPRRARPFLQLLGRFRGEIASTSQQLNLARNTPRSPVSGCEY